MVTSSVVIAESAVTAGSAVTAESVVITGAASGIGRACVELFAARGFGVVAVDLDGDGLSTLSERSERSGQSGQPEQAESGQVVPLVGDVSREETGAAMVQLALDRFGRLDVAVLNAGIGGTLPWEDAGAIERLDRILAVNVRGVAIRIRSVARLCGPPAAVRSW